MLATLARFATLLLAELVAPSRCAACEELVSANVIFCGACGVTVERARHDPHAERHVAVFDYGGAIATAIARLKYAGRFDLATRFAGVMASAAEPLRMEVDVVVPVPLHPRRLAERGFDQAALLAAPVARHLGVRHAPRALRRVRETPPQASLDRAARLTNVAFAFEAAPRLDLAGSRVLLVDDVRTTGSTLGACERALTAAGASRIHALVLASRDSDQRLLPDPRDARNVKKPPQYED